jgi:alanine dehydrogenase
MRYLDPTAARQALPMVDAIAAMEHAFTGVAETPLRSLVGPSMVMPGTLDDLMAVKVVSIVPGNPVGLVFVFGEDGSPLGIVDGPTITAIRTGAVAGLATKLMAREEAGTLAMLGSGAMAADQVEAVRVVRPIDRVIVWSPTAANAEAFAERIGAETCEDPEVAVSQADVVSCATPAREPLFAAASIRPGTHVNAVGAFTPEMAEVPSELMERAYVVVDDLAAAAAEAGDLIQAGRRPDTTLRDLLAGSSPPITGDVTFFKSVGVAAQDVAAAGRALVNAEKAGLGVVLS